MPIKEKQVLAYVYAALYAIDKDVNVGLSNNSVRS